MSTACMKPSVLRDVFNKFTKKARRSYRWHECYRPMGDRLTTEEVSQDEPLSCFFFLCDKIYLNSNYSHLLDDKVAIALAQFREKYERMMTRSHISGEEFDEKNLYRSDEWKTLLKATGCDDKWHQNVTQLESVFEWSMRDCNKKRYSTCPDGELVAKRKDTYYEACRVAGVDSNTITYDTYLTWREANPGGNRWEAMTQFLKKQ